MRIHPVSEMLPFDDHTKADPLRIIVPYFKAEPYVEYGGLDYGGTEHVSSLPQYWFVHTGAVVTALVQAGMAIVRLRSTRRM